MKLPKELAEKRDNYVRGYPKAPHQLTHEDLEAAALNSWDTCYVEMQEQFDILKHNDSASQLIL